jgi:hypothetical protein
MSTETTRPRIQLSATQVIASALAAITATVAASYLGVAGTVIGAAVASVLTVVGNAVYSHSIQRTSARVRTVVPAAGRLAPRPAPAVIESAPGRPRRSAWSVMAAACVGVFAGVLVVITGVELVAGRPLTDVLHNKAGSGTSVLGDSHPTPQTPTVTITPVVVTKTPTTTVTGTPVTTTVTPTHTAKPTTATSGPTPTPTPTDTPSAPSSSSPTGSATTSSAGSNR